MRNSNLFWLISIFFYCKYGSTISSDVVKTSVETGLYQSGLYQSAYLGQMGHVFSGSHKSLGQIIGNWIIWFIFKNGDMSIHS